jgi:hypothetical protein
MKTRALVSDKNIGNMITLYGLISELRIKSHEKESINSKYIHRPIYVHTSLWYTNEANINITYNYLLILRCRNLIEKLVVIQLFKKILISLWNRQVHHRVHKNPPLGPTLSQPSPVRPIDPHLHKVQLNVIVPPTPRSSQ